MHKYLVSMLPLYGEGIYISVAIYHIVLKEISFECTLDFRFDDVKTV